MYVSSPLISELQLLASWNITFRRKIKSVNSALVTRYFSSSRSQPFLHSQKRECLCAHRIWLAHTSSTLSWPGLPLPHLSQLQLHEAHGCIKHMAEKHGFWARKTVSTGCFYSWVKKLKQKNPKKLPKLISFFHFCFFLNITKCAIEPSHPLP